jgi:hypothetical protein
MSLGLPAVLPHYTTCIHVHTQFAVHTNGVVNYSTVLGTGVEPVNNALSERCLDHLATRAYINLHTTE